MEENKKRLDFDITDLVRIVYTKIATWHNNESGLPEEQCKASLKATSYEIIETVLNEIFSQMDGVKTGAITIPGAEMLKTENPAEEKKKD